MSWRLLTDGGEGTGLYQTLSGGVDRANDAWSFGYGDEFPGLLNAQFAPGRPNTNALFYRTDLGVAYRYDTIGAAWTGLDSTNEVHPASSDASRSDTATLQAQLTAAPNGSTIIVKPGNYNTRSAPLTITGKSGLRIIGQGLPNIRYSSAYASSPGSQTGRAGLYAVGCTDLTIEGIRWEGDQEPNITLNIGPAIYLNTSVRTTIKACQLLYGSHLFQQDATATDTGLYVTGCYSYGHRNGCNPSPYARIQDSTWELPTTSGWDRVGDLGSSHGIYLFAGRDNVTVDNCTFLNVRTYGVKMSGTVSPILNPHIVNCRFYDCGGGVLFGADGATDADHADALIEGNYFYNCANKGAGWFTDSAITVFGSYGATVRGNNLIYTRAAVTPSATKGIQAQRYYTGPTGGRTCEDVVIEDNELTYRGSGVTPGNIMTHGIYLFEAIRPIVRTNRIYGCGASAVTLSTGCTLALVHDQYFKNTVTAVQATTVDGVEVQGSRMVRGANTSGGAQIIFTACNGIETADNEECTTAGNVPMVISP